MSEPDYQLPYAFLTARKITLINEDEVFDNKPSNDKLSDDDTQPISDHNTQPVYDCMAPLPFQLYAIREAGVDEVNESASRCGYATVTRMFNDKCTYLHCDRSSQSRSTSLGVRDVRSCQIECPFKAVIRWRSLRQRGESSEQQPEHNHGPSTPETHLVHRRAYKSRMQSEIKTIIGASIALLMKKTIHRIPGYLHYQAPPPPKPPPASPAAPAGFAYNARAPVTWRPAPYPAGILSFIRNLSCRAR